MKVLVTGARGFLGGAVVSQLMGNGHAVRAFQRGQCGIDGIDEHLGSVEDRAAVDAAMTGIDAVVHLAAKVSFHGRPSEFEAINVVGTRNVVDAARNAGVSRFVLVSTPSVAHAGDSLVGVGAGSADPDRARGEYARTKAIAELETLQADTAAMPIVVVRPHIVWGPGDTQLVARVVDRARSGRLPLLGHGAALIDTTYVTNAADAIGAAVDRAPDVHGEAFVISNGEPRPVGDLLADICAAAGVGAPKLRVPAALARAAGGAVEAFWRIRPGADEPPMTRFLAEQLSTAHWFDQRRTRDALGWTPRVSIDEGIGELAAFYAAEKK